MPKLREGKDLRTMTSEVNNVKCLLSITRKCAAMNSEFFGS